jgi:polyhydroxyalkanoate synthesis regulator phasin
VAVGIVFRGSYRQDEAMDFLFDIYQQGQIKQAQGTAERAANKTDQLQPRIEELERRLDRLTLASQAMWELLRSTGRITDSQLMDKMEQVDLRDGKKDGKISGTVKICPQCRRNSNSRRMKCVYCDTPLPSPNLFEAR